MKRVNTDGIENARRGKRIFEAIVKFPEDKNRMKVTMKFCKNGTQTIETFSLSRMISFFVSEKGKPEIILTCELIGPQAHEST